MYLYIVTNEDIKPVNGSQSVVSRRSLHNYENLFRLDCLGIQENHVNSDDLVYDIFRIQLACKSL